MESLLDIFVKYSMPTICSYLVQAVDELSEEQNPPYSRGIYFIEIRMKFLTYSWTHGAFYNDMCEPIFTMAARHDFFYTDENFTKFSTRRIDDTYKTFSENIQLRFPGYEMSRSAHILPKSDITVHLDDLLSLLRSKDLARYEAEKSIFFGATSRYTTGQSRE